MGTFSVPVRIQGPSGEIRTLDALVDTGATYTLLPGHVLEQLGVQPIDHVMFQLADERTVEYPIGEVRIQVDGRQRTAVVIFGPREATPLLGATTLELCNLAVDPVGKRLVPVPGLLKQFFHLAVVARMLSNAAVIDTTYGTA